MTFDSDGEAANFPFEDDSSEDEKYTSSELAHEKWKLRELARIQRMRDARHKFEEEKREVLRRRNMTAAEIEAENERLGTDHNQRKQQTAYNFMQKYYHRGAFYQDDDQDLKQRDFNLPTGEDKADKSILPELMQKRMGAFGRKGNSKWTHLAQEDTTNFDPLTRVNEQVASKLKSKQGGFKAQEEISRPSWKRRKY